MEPKRLEEIAKMVRAIEDKEARRAVRECLDYIFILKAELTIARNGLDAVLMTIAKDD